MVKSEQGRLWTGLDKQRTLPLNGLRRNSVAWRLNRVLTKSGQSPYEQVDWELRSAVIRGDKGRVVFEQEGVETPSFWSQMAINVVASKYFRGKPDSPDRECSIRALITRVVDTVTEWGREDGYFADREEMSVFRDELTHLVLHQMASFNSPVWFNVGVEDAPQCSACFIHSVADEMESILDLVKTEGMLFKYGSGIGTNISTLRSSKERLSGGGLASGPVSFLKGFDAFAGVIKSGGKTRRAAKMSILNIDHPDIEEFIDCKLKEEKKAWALIEMGFDGSLNGEAYSSVFFQNMNNSVRVTDEFMQRVEEDGQWQTRAVTTGEPVREYRARELSRKIAEAAHACGDPGLQFDTTVNRWNTCAASGRINASNPCSEFMFLDNSACNLASLNLLKFRCPNGDFDTGLFRHAISVFILAQDIIVDRARYPQCEIARNSRRFRPLGLGYANLGSLLMAQGLAYDSEAGRDYAAAVTGLLTGQANLVSAQLARRLGPFAAYQENREPMRRVMELHRGCLSTETVSGAFPIWKAAEEVWDRALAEGEQVGYRNAQVTLLAPTGTIGFMMDCDTTGVEPELALVKFKKLSDGGILKMVNSTVRDALKCLGYSQDEQICIVRYVEENGMVEGEPHLDPAHLPIFDCAFRPTSGERAIHYLGHLGMMAAVQPFLSGAISKTINIDHDATIENIEDIYLKAWKMGLKSVSIYRDGSKRVQPLNTDMEGQDNGWVRKPVRRRLPRERRAVTHKFQIGGHEGYITVGLYSDNTPGEVFVTMSKEGSTIAGLMDVFATSVSLALQYGVPLKVLANKFCHTRFEPSGFTGNPEIPMAKSIADYIFRWLALRFITDEEIPEVITRVDNGQTSLLPGAPARSTIYVSQEDAPPCPECGSIMVRNGACYKCTNCGGTSGCS